jgi:Zn-dependent protease with chaperone function
MDFFEAQARAKKRTSRLVALFALAITGTVIAGYFATVVWLQNYEQFRSVSPRRLRFTPAPTTTPSLWQPQVLVLVTGATLLVVGAASLYKWNQFSSGGGAVAESVGGRRVDPHTTDLHERRLLNVVEEMAIASGLPVPAVYVLPAEPGINAFAAGLTTSDAAIAVTRGTIEKLTRDELQGVIGHEFSHVLNGDMRLNLRLAALVFGILVIGLAGRGILWALSRGRIRVDRKSSGLIAVFGLAGLALLIIGYVGYCFGRIIQAAVSRQREFLADASAVQFTRNPAGVTGALKKIGGYVLGSTMVHNQSAAIGHFFFAQSFRSGVTGLWSTHPPLDERIRAIEPQFDGKFFEPPIVVDVKHESFVSAGLTLPSPALRGFAAADSTRFDPVAAVASIGRLSAEDLGNAQNLLAEVPSRLRDAAHSPAAAPVLLYGLLLDDNADIRARQRELVAGRAGGDALQMLESLDASLRQIGPRHKLPLLQLAVPALKQLPVSALTVFFDVLDELVHFDDRVSTFEFALQKIVLRTLAIGRAPGVAVAQVYSFQAVADEIAVVLSVLARATTDDEETASHAFASGTAQLKLIEARLTLRPTDTATLPHLDSSLDKLAKASGPIKQRTLVAAAAVVSSDGEICIPEAELLRAIAAALDCPMPPLDVAA